MNKKILIFGGIIIVALGVAIYSFPKSSSEKTFNPLNATYTIEGESILLVNGKSEMEATPESATKITTMVFGEPVIGDLNGDGKADAGLMIVQNPGGSGTFYYAVAAINTEGGAKGTNAILLGDRVAPQTIEIRNGQIIANYADRKPNEPMTAQPSVGVSKYLRYDGAQLIESNPVAGAGENCGGNMTTAPTCISGYHCAPRPNSKLPFGDVGGICVADD